MNQFNRIADANCAQSKDYDAQELEEWCEALQSLSPIPAPSAPARFSTRVAHIARDPAIGWQPVHGTPYVNTIPVEQQPAFPGDLALEEIAGIADAGMLRHGVVRANTAYGELGGILQPRQRSRPGSKWASTISSAPETIPMAATWRFYQPHSGAWSLRPCLT